MVEEKDIYVAMDRCKYKAVNTADFKAVNICLCLPTLYLDEGGSGETTHSLTSCNFNCNLSSGTRHWTWIMKYVTMKYQEGLNFRSSKSAQSSQIVLKTVLR
ncbi:unnamed protein product [Hymenolepis diminuta]|uniref:Uncharacterized protein n=1 Tax=Hymenolepis diminuta TaxID=6216 RepID=A0A564YSV2_HYMDI|nr:unnamed protein product [Hymenolepis diminuta]